MTDQTVPPVLTLDVGDAGQTLVPDGPFTVFARHGKLDVTGRLRNAGTVTAYVFDHLWTLSSASKVVPDPYEVYRFLNGDTLTLLSGWPPLPRDRTTAVHFNPQMTAVAPGKLSTLHCSLDLPVVEYNPYYDDPTAAAFKPERAKRVEMDVEYVVAGPGLVVDPSQMFPGAFQVRGSRPNDKVRTIRLVAAGVEIDVMRRTDPIERYPSK
jgi:hypothetical protein